MTRWVARLMAWWTRPSREKREVQQKLTRFDRVLADHEEQDRFMLVRRPK